MIGVKIIGYFIYRVCDRLKKGIKRMYVLVFEFLNIWVIYVFCDFIYIYRE